MRSLIKGSGGKSGGSARVPVEEPNTLETHATAKLVYLISEGPILGLLNAEKSIYIDGVPLVGDDGEYNFEGLGYEERIGSQNQKYLPGFSAVSAEVAVGVELKQGVEVVRRVENVDVNVVVVKISLNALVETISEGDKIGDRVGTSVAHRIYYKPDGKNWIEAAVARDYVESGKITPASSKGIKVIVQETVYGRIGTEVGVRLGFEYRSYPGGSWIRKSRLVKKRILRPSVPIPNPFNHPASYPFSPPASYPFSPPSPYSPPNPYSPFVTHASNVVYAEFEYEFDDIGKSQVRDISSGYGSVSEIYSLESVDAVISGKTVSPYARSYRVHLTGDGPWDIRVVRKTEDSELTTLVNQSFWESYTEIVEAKLPLPGIAHIGILLEAKQFGGRIGEVEFDVRGLQIDLPANYDPETREYSGIWDGNFELGFSDNPAWILYSLVTNDVFGLGQRIPAEFTNKWVLYEIAKYCDELVPDGYGGMEPRFTFNYVFRTRTDAYEVVSELLQAIRAMSFWAGGAIQFAQDSPSDPVLTLTPSDIEEGEFVYQNTALKARHSVVYVEWRDESTGSFEIEVVSDGELVRRFGVRKLDVKYIGCTSRGQARRYGRWVLESEKIENDLVTFTGSFNVATLMPGDVVNIQDPLLAGIDLSGRVLDYSGGKVILDREVVDLSVGFYVLLLYLKSNRVEEKEFLVNNKFSSVEIGGSSEVSSGDRWVIYSSNIELQKYRVLENLQSDVNVFQITAIKHNPNKYDTIDRDFEFSEIPYSIYDEGIIEAPREIIIDPYLYRDGVAVKSAMDISWRTSGDSRVDYYELQIKGPFDLGYRESGGIVSTPTHTELDVSDGRYSFRLRYVSGTGGRSKWYVFDYDLVLFRRVPPDVENFRTVLVNNTMVLYWDESEDLNVNRYEIRYHKDLDVGWNQARRLVVDVRGTSLTVPLRNGSYFIKAVTRANVKSESVSIVKFSDYQELQDRLFVKGVGDYAGDGYITLERGDVLVWSDILEVDDVLDTGFDEELILSPISVDTDVKNEYFIETFASQVFLELVGNVLDWKDVLDLSDVLGIVGYDYGVKIQMRVGDFAIDAMSESDWGEWQDFIFGDVVGRSFQFRLILFSNSYLFSPRVEQWKAGIYVIKREEIFDDLISGLSKLTVNFDRSFYRVPAIAISAQDMEAGDYYTVSNKTKESFDIIFKDSANNTIIRTFDVLARGYGYGN